MQLFRKFKNSISNKTKKFALGGHLLSKNQFWYFFISNVLRSIIFILHVCVFIAPGGQINWLQITLQLV